MQDETPPSALDLLLLPLHNKNHIPSSFPISPWQTRIRCLWSFLVGNPFPLGFTGCWKHEQQLFLTGFFPGSDHYYHYWCWASREKHVFGPHTKGFG